MSSDVPSELIAHCGTTLDALGQAASKAEQAAYRYRSSTSLPFSQLDFEAEHPEWSLSAHRTSSASSSRPASANGTTALYSRSSTASANNRDLASADGRATSQAIGFPTHPIQVNPGARAKSRKPYPKEQKLSEPDKKQTCSGGEPGHLGIVNGRALKQCYRDQRSLPKDGAQNPSPTIRPSAMSNRKSHAGSVSNISISSDTTNPADITQTRLRKTRWVPSSGQDLKSNGISGDIPESQTHGKNARSIYREVVDPILQSLNSHYEEIYPQLDVSAIRQEVCQPMCTVFMIDL